MKCAALPTSFDSGLFFAPPIDRFFLAAFLRVSPAEVMLGRSADYWPVPTLVGQNDAEGMIVLMPDIITTDMTPSARNLALLQEDFERAVPVELGLARGSATSRLVADMMRTHYFQGKAISEATITNFVQITGTSSSPSASAATCVP
ncbi:uncharacterized protein LOC117650961 [Thrips palmi]|uniref:Uncharacterized protein LOC117650961 n=1 Tax=Thrips palmi TaxID=161013 RepID=A0A6P8ZYK9_THRPL|nr:uncharacterized protein LOC117650961 [Thrips palmi]